jgi:hypothetical protein
MKKRALLIGAIVALGFGVSYYAYAQNDQSAAVRSATVITVHGRIAGVDKAKKQITLEATNGREVILGVENPHNLEAAKVGEPVAVRYYEVVSVRKKKPEENVPSASVQEGIATAKPGGAPGAVAEQRLSLLVSVAAIDKTNGTVTIKAPDGTTETVKARNPKNLDRFKVGDDLVVTLSRATAIAVAKESGS